MHSDSLDALSAINSPRAPQPPPAESSAAAPKGRRNRNNASPTKDRDFENGFAFGSSRSATTTAHQGEADINDDAVDESDAPPGVATGSMSAGRGKTAVHKQQVVGSAKSGWGEDSVLNSEASKRRFNKRVENGQSKSTAEKLNRGASSRDNDFGDEKDQDDDDDNEGNDDNGNEIVPKRGSKNRFSTRNEVTMIIPDLNDVEEDEIITTVAAPPSLKVNKVKTIRELDGELSISTGMLSDGMEGIDLSLLMSFALCPPEMTFEEDKHWDWDVTFLASAAAHRE